jgi:NAD(P)-dependent dehydrogenase (short-subunit alcohol dehydrogenase family)
MSGPQPAELEGKIALVTGAAQGLGLAMARALAERGARVTIADLQEDKARAAARGLKDSGLAAEAIALDIASSASVDRVFQAVASSGGRLDIVVNNAGVGQTVAAISQLADAEWQRVIGITLTGTFSCCRAAARIMEGQASGVIVNIASINGQNPGALVAAYNAAKAGVISLTRTLALELAAYGVRVNAVCPGPVYTDFNKTVMSQRGKILGVPTETMVERVRSSIPLGRWGEPEDIAEVVAFLCGPHSAWMTGRSCA